MIEKKTVGEQIFNIFNILLMLVLIVISLYPLMYVLFASVSDPRLLIQAHGEILWRPVGNINLAAYRLAFSDPTIMTGYLNTLIVVTGGLAINLFLTSMGAYCLSRKDVYWNRLFTILIIITMVFTGGIIPLALTVRGLGLFNSRWALVLPVAVNTFNLIIMRTAMKEIPDSLVESAQIDGAGHVLILFRIMLPLSKAVLAVMVLYYGVGHWNAWAHAVMFIQSPDRMPLQVVLRNILLQNQFTDAMQGIAETDRLSVSETIRYATIIIATVPILMLYPFLQKFFAKGVMIGSVKG